MVLVLLPQIEHPLGVDGSLVDGARYSQVDEFAGWNNSKQGKAVRLQ